jgi:hypothetical protein
MCESILLVVVLLVVRLVFLLVVCLILLLVVRLIIIHFSSMDLIFGRISVTYMDRLLAMKGCVRLYISISCSPERLPTAHSYVKRAYTHQHHLLAKL